MRITIDYDKCTNDLECVKACPVDVIINRDDKPFVSDPESCLECHACMDACPSHAVLVES